MLTDRISLILAYGYLYGASTTEGTISNIVFSYTNQFTTNTTSKKFNSLADLASQIDLVAPIMSINQAECTNMGIYELKSFNIQSGKGTYGFVQNTTSGWKTTQSSFNAAVLDSFNQYQSTFNQAEELYNKVYLQEYIQQQYQYIDCGYIQTLYGPIIDQIQILYQKYKRI